MSKWTQLNESIDEIRNIAREVSVDMTEVEADMAISEALCLGTEGKYIARDIAESVKAFNLTADQKGYDNFEYLSEAVGGGFFKKVIDILIKFWQTIVNYVKALLSRFTSSSDITKRLKDLEALLPILKAKNFKKDVKISFKNYRMSEGASLAGKLLNPEFYIETKLIDKDDNTTIKAITQNAANIANNLNGILKGGEINKDGAERNLTDYDEKVKTLEKISKDIGFGEKGAAKMLYKLMELSLGFDAIKKLLEDVKAKDASNLTTLLKDLLSKVLDKSAAEVSYDQGQIADAIGGIETSVVALKAGGAKDTSKNAEAVLTDKFEEGRKQAQDILDKLKEASNKIDAYSKTAEGNVRSYEFKKDEEGKTTNDKEYDDKSSVVEKHAEGAGKLATILTEIQAGMQECLTKGMDTGLVLLKAMLSELEYRAKAIDKLPTENRVKETV